jgi:MSHA pilin protein MshD
MTLIELIIVILILGVALSGVLTAFMLAFRHNVDPLVRKQALAVAESLMEEVASRAFALEDLHNPEAHVPNGLGPEAATGETRTSATVGFDHVDDYHQHAQSGVLTDAAGQALGLTGSYATCVIVTPTGAALAGVPAGQALWIAVYVFGPGGAAMGPVCTPAAMSSAQPLARLDAYRAQYDPSP